MSSSPTDSGRAPVGLDRTLTHRLHRLQKLSDRASQRAYAHEAEMSMGEGRCLAAVGAFEPLSVNDLAQGANLTKGQASRAAQALVDAGLVRKRGDGDDGRGVVLTLTSKGRARWRKVMTIIQRRNDEIFGCLTAEETQQLGSMLDRLIAASAAQWANLD